VTKYAFPIENPELSAGYLIRDTFLAFSKLMRVWLQPYKITLGQYFFLRALWIEEGLSQRELSRRVGTTEPTTVAALRLLERNCLVERVRNADDRRTINIFLTDRARAQVRPPRACDGSERDRRPRHLGGRDHPAAPDAPQDARQCRGRDRARQDLISEKDTSR